jgi:serine protease Do
MTTRARETCDRRVAYTAVAALVVVMLASAKTARADGAAESVSLQQFSDSVQSLVARVSPSVVQILVTGYGPLDDKSQYDTDLVVGKQRSLASGVIITPNGYIVTNAHVVAGGQRIKVVLSDAVHRGSSARSLVNPRGRVVEARIVGVARDVDLALLKIDSDDLPALPLANYEALQQGELVFAFGSPEGLRNSVTMGVVSAVARQPDADQPMVYVQTDAPINHGNSGGPLVNVRGELVGINTFIVSESGGSEGIGFAIPSDLVEVAAQQLRRYGRLHQGQIGANLQTVTPTLAKGLGLVRESGVLVSDLMPDGPACRAGLKVADIIVSIDGRPIDSLPLLSFYLYTRAAGDHLRMVVLRGNETVGLDVPVVERPQDVDVLAERVNPEESLVRQLGVLGIGITEDIEGMVPSLRDPSGVIVAARTEDPQAADVSLATGDVIHAVNGRRVTTLPDLRSALERLKPHSPVVLQIERNGSFSFVSFELD